MFELTCCVLGIVAVCITNVHAGTVVGPSIIQEFNDVIFECANEHHVTDNELHTAIQLEDINAVNPCFWTCCLNRAGFLDDKGHFILEAGLTYARNFIKRDDVYTIIANIATQCQTVLAGKDMCDRGALIAACFVEQIDLMRFFSKR